jgi:hypothetical protein
VAAAIAVGCPKSGGAGGCRAGTVVAALCGPLVRLLDAVLVVAAERRGACSIRFRGGRLSVSPP